MSDAHVKQLSDLKVKIKEARVVLAELRQEIKDANEYRKSQTDLVADTISDLNSQLIEFNLEIGQIQLEKNKASTDIIRLQQDKAALKREVEVIENRLDELDEIYTNRVEEYKSQLNGYKEKIALQQS